MMLPIRVELNDPFKVQDRLQYLKVKVQKKFVDMVSDSTFPFIFKKKKHCFSWVNAIPRCTFLLHFLLMDTHVTSSPGTHSPPPTGAHLSLLHCPGGSAHACHASPSTRGSAPD